MKRIRRWIASKGATLATGGLLGLALGVTMGLAASDSPVAFAPLAQAVGAFAAIISAVAITLMTQRRDRRSRGIARVKRSVALAIQAEKYARIAENKYVKGKRLGSPLWSRLEPQWAALSHSLFDLSELDGKELAMQLTVAGRFRRLFDLARLIEAGQGPLIGPGGGKMLDVQALEVEAAEIRREVMAIKVRHAELRDRRSGGENPR